MRGTLPIVLTLSHTNHDNWDDMIGDIYVYMYVGPYVWMDGWMDGWMIGWIDGCVCMDGCLLCMLDMYVCVYVGR